MFFSFGGRFSNSNTHCTALDRQPPTESSPLGRTMKYGFANQVPAPDPINPETIPYLGRYNECIDCVSIGHLAPPAKNMHRAFCQVKRTAPQVDVEVEATAEALGKTHRASADVGRARGLCVSRV